ncbi:MAG: HAMP domain-containing histidine kinase [Planctomycetes bacterium]|nr:HAMP domain-containing histidine kinase [Planctomycetota bacterium]
MRSHSRRAWSWFVGTALVLIASLVWLSSAIVGLDRDEVRARRLAADEQKMRLALWRMDSWLSPRLARESMRPASEYQAFAPAPAAWTRGFSRIAPDEVLVPSPLLSFSSELFPLHFELRADGRVSSPQVPTGNQRDVAEVEGRDGASFEAATRRLEQVRQRLEFAAVSAELAVAESQLQLLGCNLVRSDIGPMQQRQVVDYDNRQVANAANQGQLRLNALPEPVLPDPVPSDPAHRETIGPMVPLWLSGAEPMLVFTRRVSGANQVIQGVVIDWPTLQRELGALVTDLFAADRVEIARCVESTPEQGGTMLASVPARLIAHPGRDLVDHSYFAWRMLPVVWAGVLLALAALGFTLRAALGFGERRARFASAVTHELRTPLTTFRLYSEMLADDVVTDPQARHEYLETLRQESDRLARVVENVLAWSRLEQGRFASRRERHRLADLLSRQEPQLARRLGDAGLQLELRIDAIAAAAEITTDEEAVGQILFNLVDNAAKYARDAGDRRVTLAVHLHDADVVFEIRDRGPGVPAAFARRIFSPFDRGAVPTATNEQPGVGLGLALSRGLARDLGGDLELEAADPGARFRLRLPRPRTSR